MLMGTSEQQVSVCLLHKEGLQRRRNHPSAFLGFIGITCFDVTFGLQHVVPEERPAWRKEMVLSEHEAKSYSLLCGLTLARLWKKGQRAPHTFYSGFFLIGLVSSLHMLPRASEP